MSATAPPPDPRPSNAPLARRRRWRVCSPTSAPSTGSTDCFVNGLLTIAIRKRIASIGAPFWGLLIGFAVSWALERGDLATATGGPK